MKNKFKKIVSWVLLIIIGISVLWNDVVDPVIQAIKNYGLIGLVASVIVICMLIIIAFLLTYIIKWCIDNINE